MDEQDTKSCPNCKREILASNFTIHSVHCARNIKMCPVCKEPVPFADLQLHHEEMHKPQPCKKCGESVCGTDLEDHVRDSCAHTIQTCKFCELELPRRELPAHEGYCGARTEQCADCREWVMLKYRQLHLDSNHGFLRLDDDPDPKPKKETAKVTRIPKVNNAAPAPTINGPSTSNGNTSNNIPSSSRLPNGFGPSTRIESPFFTTVVVPPNVPRQAVKNTNLIRDKCTNVNAGRNNVGRETHHFCHNAPPPSTVEPPSSDDEFRTSINLSQPAPKNRQESTKKKTNSRGAIKKRAPPPPEPLPLPARDLPYYSALRRQQDELRQRQEINAERRTQGLPPILTPAEKVEKLRKMDAVHNREVEVDYKNRLQGRVWGDPTSTVEPSPMGDLRNLTPMSPDQFIKRFSALQLESDGSRDQGRRVEPRQNRVEESDRAESRGNDRFSMIKSSLQELRRGLNAVTAPYNSNATANDIPPRYEVNQARNMSSAVPPARGPGWTDSPPSSDEEIEVRLPCEFCGRPQPMDSLVQHQTGCRPDLAQLRVSPARGPPPPTRGPPPPARSPPPPAPPPHPDPHELPVIPCEFCTESLPVYLINEHQERCRLDNEMY